MAGFSIKLQVDDAAVRQGLAELARRGRNLRPVMDAIGAALVSGTDKRFEDQRDPEGKPWAPLAASTLLRRAGKKAKLKSGGFSKRARERMANAKILLDQAMLVRSLTHRADDAAVAVGTNLVYGRIHQLGGVAGRGRATTITARPYLGASASDVQTIGGLLARHLAGAS